MNHQPNLGRILEIALIVTIGGILRVFATSVNRMRSQEARRGEEKRKSEVTETTSVSAAELWANYIDEELKSEMERSTNLNTRAFAIATSSSAFIALLLAVLTLFAPDKFKFSGLSATLAASALVVLAIAAILGLLANIAEKYEVGATSTLAKIVREHWHRKCIRVRFFNSQA